MPAHIPRPPYAESGKLPDWDTRPQVHDAAGIEKMRAAGRLAAQVLAHAGSLVRPGITTDAIDKAVHKMTIEAGAYPSPLNYGAHRRRALRQDAAAGAAAAGAGPTLAERRRATLGQLPSNSPFLL